MRKGIRVLALVVLVALIAIVALQSPGASAAKKPPSEPTCLCPDVMDPVICSNGVTYSNFCYAGCAGVTGCVRTGDI
jgi:hypothetical protein